MTCEYCQATHNGGYATGRFCGADCKNKFCSSLGNSVASAVAADKRDEARNTYNQAPKLCVGCNAPIPFEDKRQAFCTHSCAASFNNRKRGFKSTRTCTKCGAVFPRKGSEHRHLCVTCRDPETRRLSSSKGTTLKKQLIISRGHQCESCGLTHWLGELIKLQLDHVDGNSDNNAIVNLRLLCPTCHTMTPTWGSKNIGTKSKRNRYRQDWRKRTNRGSR